MLLPQMYNSIDDVVVGQRLMYDNTSGFIAELPRIRLVGDVLGSDKKKQTVSVEFKVRGFDPMTIDLPYFLAQ
jgi:hypothetical protein